MAVKDFKEVAQVFADAVRHARRKPLEDMVGKNKPPPGKPDFRKEIRPGVKPETMDASERLVFRKLLDDRDLENKVGVRHIKQAKTVGAAAVEVVAIHHGRVAQNELVKTVAAMVRADDARR